MLQAGLDRELLTHGVEFALAERRQEIALENDPLALAPGEPFVGEMLGARIHRLAHFAAEAAGAERHRLLLDQPVIEPGRARRGDLCLEVEVGAIGEDDGGPGIVRAAEAADLDDAADRRRVLERLDAAQPDVMGATIGAVDHGIGFAGQARCATPCRPAGR